LSRPKVESVKLLRVGRDFYPKNRGTSGYEKVKVYRVLVLRRRDNVVPLRRLQAATEELRGRHPNFTWTLEQVSIEGLLYWKLEGRREGLPSSPLYYSTTQKAFFVREEDATDKEGFTSDAVRKYLWRLGVKYRQLSYPSLDSLVETVLGTKAKALAPLPN
jgi:hypothetical protein